MEHLWDVTERGKLRFKEKNLSQCPFLHNKSHMNWPDIENRPPGREAGDCLNHRMAYSVVLFRAAVAKRWSA